MSKIPKPDHELTPELAGKLYKGIQKRLYDQKVSKEAVLHHLKQLKAHVGKLKNKNDRFPHMELAYNNAIMKCMGAIDQKIKKIES